MKYFLLGFSLMIVAGFVFASEKHHTYPAPVVNVTPEIVIQPYETHTETITHETTIIDRVIKESSGTALVGAQSQIQFDKNISGLQMGVGVYTYDNREGYAIGIGKQIKDKTILNFTIGREGDKTGYGVGFNFTR